MNRRDFLRRIEEVSASIVAGGACLSIGSSCIGFHYVNTTVQGNRVLIRPEDFGTGSFVLVDAPGHPLPLYVYRLEEGGFSAVSTRCMHRGCQVEPAAGHLVCPCHGSEYSNTGEVLKGPTQRPLRRFPVTEEANAIVVDLAPAPPSGGGA